MLYPNGYIVLPETLNSFESFIVYGEMDKNGYVSKGYKIEIPNLDNSGDSVKNSLFLRLANFLSRLEQDCKVQFRFTRDTDFNEILEPYNEQTQSLVKDCWSKSIRNSIYNNFIEQIKNRKVRREHVHVYFSIPIKNFKKDGLVPESVKSRKRFERQVKNAFTMPFQSLKEALRLNVEPLNHIELFKEFYQSYNKSSMETDIDYSQIFTPEIEEIVECEFMKSQNEEISAASFCADGYYHNILTLADFPKTDTTPFFGNQFLNNDIQNLTIVVNIEALDIAKYIKKKEKLHRRVEGDVNASPSSIAQAAGLDDLEDQIWRFGKGEEIPLRIEYIIHTWNSDQKELHADTMVLRQAASSMFTSLVMYDLGLQAMHNFLKTLPGNLFYKNKDASLDCNHSSLSSIIPFNSSFAGKGKDGNILFAGDHGNIMSIGFFDGPTPQHMLCLGQSGSGKSVNFASILSQSFFDFEKIVIIEEGGSYSNLSKIYSDSSESIIIDPNGRLTLNYFDTCGVPLSPGQIEFVTMFLVGMCGESKDAEIIQDRTALISAYVIDIYNDTFIEWKSTNSEALLEVAKLSMTVEWMLPFMPPERNTELDSYFELKDILEKSNDERESFDQEVISYYNSISSNQATDYILEDSDTIRNIAFALIPREEMPYHSQIVEAIRDTPKSNHNIDETNRIANRIAVYSIESGKGCLFDGYTTIDLSKKFIHIELSRLANCSSVMKNLVGIVINNLVQNQIIGMARSDKKLYIFEEAARFLSIPGAADIIKQSYAQFRKYTCVAVTVTQSIAQMEESGVGKILMTQSKSFMFLKNTDKKELEALKPYIQLSDNAITSIKEFPSPEHIAGEKYSSFLYYAQRDQWPIVGVGRNYASTQLLVAAATSGELHSKVENIVKTLSLKNKSLSFAEKILKATELLKEDTRLLKLLGKIEKLGDKKVKALILDAKLEALKVL